MHDHGPAVVGVAAYGLAGSRIRPPAGPLDRAAWDQLARSCAQACLLGLLAAAVADGAIRLRDGQAADLAVLAAESGTRTQDVQQRVVKLSRELTTENVGHFVLDGPALAHRAYADPPRRQYAAASVLVEASRLPRSHRLDPTLAGTVRFVHGLAPPAAGFAVPLADLGSQAETVRIGGEPVPVIPAPAQLLYTGADATARAGVDRLLAMRDVAQLVLAGNVEPDTAQMVLRRWRATAVVAQAIRLAWLTFDLADKTKLSAWAFRYDATPAERRALRAPSVTAHGRHRAAAAAHRIADVLLAPVRREVG